MEPKIQTEELQIKVPWGHVAARAWGSSKNSPILVVHGILDNAGSFNRLLPLLPRRFYYVCIDLPGHGLSSHLPAGMPLDFFNFVLCIEFVIKALEWKDFIFLGHSLGGLIGAFYVSLYPGRVKKLIALDLGLAIDFSGDKLITRIQKILKDALENYNNNSSQLNSYDDVIYALQYKRMNCLNEEAAKAMFERAVTKVGDSFKYNRDPRLRISVRPLFNLNQYFTVYKRINIPVLFILTSVNAAVITKVPEIKEGLDTLRGIKSLEYVIVEGNHDVHNNYPERVSQVIRKFLDFNISSKL